jgi:ABC-type antimicrobial peptide transport system permease subunit
MGIKVLQGRDFSEDFKTDSSAIIVNKAALAVMGLKNPIGETVTLWDNQHHIVGVVDDVLMGSPYQAVKPMMLILQKDWTSAITIRLSKTSDMPGTIKKVEDVFKKLNPSFPFVYSFADADFEQKFSTINLISQLSKLFASLAIIITGLGLFGLAAFTAEQRTKEIGIRKVLGATVSSLVVLISKDFTRLVVLSFVIASPIAWWLLDDFLKRYPYRINIPWWIIPSAGLVTLVLAIIIVSTQAIKAASANPSQSLRSE